MCICDKYSFSLFKDRNKGELSESYCTVSYQQCTIRVGGDRGERQHTHMDLFITQKLNCFTRTVQALQLNRLKQSEASKEGLL